MNYNVKIDEFEGPLDLLLHLIKQDNIDIYDISIERITKQYLDYINQMESLNINIGANYLIMAAELMEMKSNMLLPQKKVEEDDEEELTRDRNSFIGVDDIRSIDKFIHMSPSGFSGWKMVIIDSADEMNLNASNALLKILEEPPEQTVMILISHNQSKLLPTILSRCRKVYFSCMRKDEIVDGLRGLGFDISSEEARGLSYLSGGSLGKAVFLKSNGGLNTYNDILNLFINFPQVNVNSIYKFTEKKEKEEKSYKLLKEVYITFLYRLICIQSGLIEEGYISELEKEVTGRILSLSDKEKLLLLWERSTELFNQAEVLYLDKKQVMVDSLLELSLCL